MNATPAPLAGDLDAGLRRLRLGAMRRLAAEVVVTAKTQRWSPEEFLRTLVEAEIASRDASNARARLKRPPSRCPRRWRASTWPRRRSSGPPSTTW